MVRLVKDAVELVLAPSCGGGIAAFRWCGIDVMRPALPLAQQTRPRRQRSRLAPSRPADVMRQPLELPAAQRALQRLHLQMPGQRPAQHAAQSLPEYDGINYHRSTT